jgi:hypothetical protein
MDRRYYGLKALILAAAIVVALGSSFFGARPLFSPTAHIHYSAAASVQSAVTETTMKVSRAIGKFIAGKACLVRF